MTLSGWHTPLRYLKGVGPARSRYLAKMGLVTAEDLLFHLPFRYEDRSKSCEIARLVPGEVQFVSGVIESVRFLMTPRKHLKIIEATLQDRTGRLTCKWFNQPFLEKRLKPGTRIFLTGKTSENPFAINRLEMSPLGYELDQEPGEESVHYGRVVPIYHETAGMNSRALRTLVSKLLSEPELIPKGELLPDSLTARFDLPPLGDALKEVHFPSGIDSSRDILSGSSRHLRRLILEEFYLLQTGLTLRKNRMAGDHSGHSFTLSGNLENKLLRRLPFFLTDAQKRVLNEIKHDMASGFPMSRLLQGDVGSGKTVIALIAMLAAVEDEFQASFMVPTEILAEQHYAQFQSLLKPIGVSVGLLTHAASGKGRKEILERIAGGSCQLVIGTHALVQEKVRFRRLGLVVIDEQHKFGVLQRMEFKRKGENPDILVMTATPIPRTLALTLYGDLDLSLLDELPPGRKPVRTRILNEKERDRAYALIRTEIEAGRQAYIVYPLIEASEATDLKAAVTMAGRLQAEIFPDIPVGLLHGRMTSEEKEAAMRSFKEGRLKILVTTTVVEVGVDVTSASVMVIEHAERFGLAQLHQLRGRVGRGPFPSYCILIAKFPLAEDAGRRLRAMVRSSNGFVLAEEDLSIRGPGEFFGTRQSGIPELRVASLLRDGKWLEIARREAVDRLKWDPLLERNESRVLRQRLIARWEEKLEFITTG